MRKRNVNAGYSMVELIVVVTIMATLVAVLAPQYLKYVKQSKISTDISNASNIANAVGVALADETVSLSTPNKGTVINVTASDLPNVNEFPESKVDRTYTWTIVVDYTGLTKIELGGYEIWPNPNDATTGYRVNNS